MQKTKTKIVESDDSFHNGIGRIIQFNQLFGMFPISGATNRDPNTVQYRWISIRTLYSLLIICTSLMYAITEAKRLKPLGMNATNINGLVFSLTNVVTEILFFNLSMKWGSIMVFWQKIEAIFLSEPYRIKGWSLKRKLRITFSVILFFAVIEHLFSLMTAFYYQYHEIARCKWNVTDPFRHYFVRSFPGIFLLFPYNIFVGILFQFNQLCMAIFWSLCDLIIIMMSIGLSYRFDQINEQLVMIKQGKILVTEQFWIRIREHYVKLCELLGFVGDKISAIILLSCTSNLYFICLQTLHLSQPVDGWAPKIYYWYSFSFLIFRTVITLLCTAAIHDASKKPLSIIQRIPNEGWCCELERFVIQLRSETIALNGMGFFNLTRKTLFSVTKW